MVWHIQVSVRCSKDCIYCYLLQKCACGLSVEAKEKKIRTNGGLDQDGEQKKRKEKHTSEMIYKDAGSGECVRWAHVEADELGVR